MAAEIKVWQIIKDKLELIETTMIEAGQKLDKDLDTLKIRIFKI